MFKFKKFSVAQRKVAMKVGTDGVLLGAWSTPPFNRQKILDIGTGTGLIALMLAQRFSDVTIDAIEIDELAFLQAKENFLNSNWSNRLNAYHTPLQDFLSTDQYDLIISNPPFFTENYFSTNIHRNLARNTVSLSFEELLLFVANNLKKDGFFEVIIPFSEEKTFLSIAQKMKLYPCYITRMRGRIDTPTKRSLMRFSFVKSQIIIDELVIEIERHVYTDAYISLTKDFYLKV